MNRIVDDNHYKAYLNKFAVKKCQHLNFIERYRLINFLKKSEDLFDVTLGKWNTTPVDLELKDDANPVCLQPYPVLRLNEMIFKKEVKRIVILGVLEEANDSEWEAPSFPQPKTKTNRVIFSSYFRDLNRQSKPNPYTIPKIREILLNL